MIDKIYEGQILRFVDEEHKKAYFKNLNLKEDCSAFRKLKSAMDQETIHIQEVIEGCVDKANGIRMTYNPILQTDYVYFKETESTNMDKIVSYIKSAFKAGKESEILELTINEILQK